MTEKIEQHKKVDYIFTNIFSSLNSIITSIKENTTTKIEDVNCLEIASSTELLLVNFNDIFELISNLRIEAIKKQDICLKPIQEETDKNRELETKFNELQDKYNLLSNLSNDIKSSKYYLLSLSSKNIYN
jgi:hypothetical protein